jgi:hypothetical protein
MKGYPSGYPDPDNRFQQQTARRHSLRRQGKPPTALDLHRIEAARMARSGHAARYSRDWAEADLKRRQGQPLSPAEQALLTNGDR